jgi:hypothetical protein
LSHTHWCDYAGHHWECPGTAIRLFQAEPSVCMCIQHGVPMEDGDHNACFIELLLCPEHRADQMRAMGYEPEYTEELPPDQESSMFRDERGNKTVGFCVWCGRDFFTLEEHYAHWGEPTNCPVFKEYIEKHPAPPASQETLEDARFIDPKEQK